LLFDHLRSSNYSIKAMVALASLLILASCQVKPLYGNKSSGDLPGVNISQADDRLELVVRNHLSFLLGANDASPKYQLDLNVTSAATGLLDSGTDGNFTAGTMTATSDYTLTTISDNEVVIKGQRKATAQYDLPNQEFSKIRALQDAEDRAGRALAELIKTDILIATQNN